MKAAAEASLRTLCTIEKHEGTVSQEYLRSSDLATKEIVWAILLLTEGNAFRQCIFSFEWEGIFLFNDNLQTKIFQSRTIGIKCSEMRSSF